jgi:hypothetical protein
LRHHDAIEREGEQARQGNMGDDVEYVAPAEVAHVREEDETRNEQAMLVVQANKRRPRIFEHMRIETWRAVPLIFAGNRKEKQKDSDESCRENHGAKRKRDSRPETVCFCQMFQI